MKQRLLTTTLAALGLTAAATTCAQAQGAAKPAAGDPRAGESKAAMCIGCHGIEGYQASFPEVYKVPMINGQGAAYIVAALDAYAKGERKHPTMRSVAVSLSEQDKADLAAFYAGSAGEVRVPDAPGGELPAQVAELLKKGNCASCHGANFSKPIDPSYPKLAGQHPDYLFHSLRAYQTKNSAQVGRANAVMGGMAAPFSSAELKVLAQYLGSLPGELKTVAQARFR